METKSLERLIKICRENGVKEVTFEGLRMVFHDDALITVANSPIAKPPGSAKSPQIQDETDARKQQDDFIDDLIVTDPARWEEYMLNQGVTHGN